MVVEKYPTHEIHYLPFKPGILDQAYRRFGESILRPFFLVTKLMDVFLAQFTLAFTSFSNFSPYLRQLVVEEKPEKLLISGEPFYLFGLGYMLNKKFGIPWIADYRDDWSTNELQVERSGGKIRKWIAGLESKFEKKWVGSADLIISVSKPYTQRISEFLNKPGITVQNGFEESFFDLPPTQLFDQFTIMYSGVLYPSQDIRPILGVLESCYKKNNPFRLIFLGAGYDIKEKKRIEAQVPAYLSSFVEVTDRFPREKALEMLHKAHILLGIAYGNMKGIPSSKLYEYLAIGKPVLLCPTDSDQMESILTDSGLGFFASNEKEGEENVLKIMDLYQNPDSLNELKAQSREKIMKYSRYNQLRTLATSLTK